MKLNVSERIAILQIIPVEGDFTILKILRELQENINFSEEDHKKFKIRRFNKKGEEDGGGDSIRWDVVEGLKEVEIEIGDKGKQILKDVLVKLDADKKLVPTLFSVYEKFVQDKGGEK